MENSYRTYNPHKKDWLNNSNNEHDKSYVEMRIIASRVLNTVKMLQDWIGSADKG